MKTLDRLIRYAVPSGANLSYQPVFKVVGNAVSSLLGMPFSRFRKLPPNHLRVRVGVGNQIFNNQAFHYEVGARFWHEFFANGYATAKSDVLEIGCGCGRIAMHLIGDFFTGTYVGIDIDSEMIDFCRRFFPKGRFVFVLSPHKSTIYHGDDQSSVAEFHVGPADSKDFVYSTSLYTHLLEKELAFYMDEAFRVLRKGGQLYMTFFCLEHVEIGGRWTFSHQLGNARVENEKYPEAAVAYSESYMIESARKAGFSKVWVIARPGQSALCAKK